MTKKDSGEPVSTVEIKIDECKGCELCIQICPKKVLGFSKTFNKLGYQYVVLEKDGCSGCGICFYACPEPGALTVIKVTKGNKEEDEEE